MKIQALMGSAASLGIIQAADFLIPLVAIPFLVRTLGVSGYGEIAFAQALCGYFLIITEFGFGFSAARSVAAFRGDSRKLSEIFWNVQVSKLLLVVVSFAALAVLVALSHKLREMAGTLAIAMLPSIGSILFPLWYFHGLERLRSAALIALMVRIALLATIFCTVRSAADSHLAVLLLSLPPCLAGLVSWGVLGRSLELRWMRPSRESIYGCLQEGKHAFLATAASSIYRSSNAVVLGFLSTPSSVALYSLTEKVVRATQEINKPFAQATYPRMSSYAKDDRYAATALFWKLSVLVVPLALLASLSLFLLAPMIVEIVGGPALHEAIPVLRVLSLVPLVGCLNLLLGVQTLHPFGFAKQFSRFVAISGAANLVLIGPLVFWLDARGAALSYLCSEVLLLLNLARFHSRQRMIQFRLPLIAGAK